MKYILTLFFLGCASYAHASQLGCEDTIRIAVNTTIQDSGMNEVVTRVTLDKDYDNVAVYQVMSGLKLDPGMIGIPKVSYWVVTVQKTPQATCSVASVLLDMEAH